MAILAVAMMHMRQWVAAAAVFGAIARMADVGARPVAPHDGTAAAEWCRRGLELGYNLDRTEAMAAFRRATEADPESASAHRLLAATAWTAMLFKQGEVSVEDYLGATHDVKRPAPDPELAAQFRQSLDRALQLAEGQVHEHPEDIDAQYQLGATNGLQAAYAATIEGRVAGSLTFVRRAYRTHDRLLKAAPSRADAGLIVGVYRYTVSTLSMPKRFAAYLVGLDGGRDEGIRLVESAAASHSDAQPQAMFSLVLIYNRERRYNDALRVIRDLKERFPRNRLLWLEEGRTQLRAGRPDQARTLLESGLARFQRDARPKAHGEESRWRYVYGAVLTALDDRVHAGQELHAALELATRDWVRGRIHLELATLAGRNGKRFEAITAYQEAERFCRLDGDEACEDDARNGLRKTKRP